MFGMAREVQGIPLNFPKSGFDTQQGNEHLEEIHLKKGIKLAVRSLLRYFAHNPYHNAQMGGGYHVR